jgi:hypothetical protein
LNTTTRSVVGKALGTPGKTLLYNSNIAFSYPGYIVSLDTSTNATSNISIPEFTHFTVDPSNVFYTSNGTIITRETVGNSNIVYFPRYTALGPNFYFGSNLYTLANDSTLIIYNSNSAPFASTEMPASQNVSTVYTIQNYAYYPPGLNGNIIQRYDMTFPFYSSDSYSNILSSNNN